MTSTTYMFFFISFLNPLLQNPLQYCLYVCELISDVIFGCPRTTDNIVNRPGENGTAGLREFPFMALLGYDKNKYETRLHDILTQ